MINKTIIQIILSVLIILSLLVFYNTYFTNNKKPSLQTEKLDEKEIKKNDKQNLKSNLIYNLDYKSTDIDNNQYFINSESGIMSESGSEFLMNKVNARIILNDLSVIIISSDKALYNNANYNTKFYGNVVAKYEEQTIFSQNINCLAVLGLQPGLQTNAKVAKNQKTVATFGPPQCALVCGAGGR